MLRRFVLPALLLLAVYYAVFGGEYSIFDLRSVQAQVEEARQELSQLEARRGEVAARAHALENDPVTLETLARERFGMIRDGEVLYRFAGDSDGPDGAFDMDRDPGS